MAHPGIGEVVGSAGELLVVDDAARAEVWVSGMLAIWRQPPVVCDPVEVDLELLAAAERLPSAATGALAAAATGLGDPRFQSRAQQAAESIGIQPPWACEVGTASVFDGWLIRGAGRLGCVLGFEQGDRRHSLLGDVDPDSGVLANLAFGPDPGELLAGLAETSDTGLEVVDADPMAVAERLVAAWRALLSDYDPTDEFLMNHLAAESRLRGLLGEQVAGLCHLPAVGATPVRPPMADAEITEANQWAQGLLRTALGVPDGRRAGGQPQMASRIVTAAEPVGPLLPEGLAAREQAGLETLEWADWLGAVIGLVRAGPGAPADPSALVDYVNRCPEISSTIPAEDREWIEWGFSLALRWWVEAGVVDEDLCLTPEGQQVLPLALERAWR